MAKKNSYENLGASATKAGLHRALASAGVPEETGLFARVTADQAGDPDYCSFLHCDGAGTKSVIAYLAYRETGDPQHFAGLAQDATVMNLDDVFCLGPVSGLSLANALGRNARLVDDDAVGAIIGGYRKLCETFSAHGVAIELAGGETADVGDVVRTLLVDAVVTGRIAKSQIVDTRNIVPGDVIIGLESTGRASYENFNNSGIGSNGLTLARHSLLSKKYREQFPEVVDPGLDTAATYRGPFSLSDTPDGLGMSIADALLSPTRSYAPVLAKLYAELPKQIHGVIHVTGGGQGKVLRFGTPGNLYVKDKLFKTPAIFELVAKHGEVSWEEMYRVFNMGHRLEVYLPADNAQTVIDIAKSFDIAAQQIGHVAKSDSGQNEVHVHSEHGSFQYKLD